MATCPNCTTEFKKSFFGNNLPFRPEIAAFVHAFTTSKSTGYRQQCGPALFDAARNAAQASRSSFENTVQQCLPSIPILSLQAPANWHFRPLAMVSGQSVTGTGVFSEFASSWTDLFGAQSGAYNKKIAQGEMLCRMQLRLKCLELGGNAVLATDIDYAEVGGEKGMLMVCMAGTAVHLEDTSVLSEPTIKSLQILDKALADKKALEQYQAVMDGQVLMYAELPGA